MCQRGMTKCAATIDISRHCDWVLKDPSIKWLETLKDCIPYVGFYDILFFAYFVCNLYSFFLWHGVKVGGRR